MTKSDLIKKMMEKYPDIPMREMHAVVNAIFASLSEALIADHRIELRGFGAFSLRKRAPRKARNPKTNETVELAERASIYFRSGKELRARLNQ